MRNAKLEHTVRYWTARADMRIIELENRCTGNRATWRAATKPRFAQVSFRAFVLVA
jgi:hypothetical protein